MLKSSAFHIDLNTVRIESARLLIRAINPSDTTDIFREFTAAVTRFMLSRPFVDRPDTEAFVYRSLQRMRDHAALTVVILDKATGAFLGCMGLHGIDAPTPEFGIWLKESAWGSGYGQEAVHGLKEWADRHLHYDYLRYPVDIRNQASLAIPESLGGQIARQYVVTGGLNQELILAEYRIGR